MTASCGRTDTAQAPVAAPAACLAAEAGAGASPTDGMIRIPGGEFLMGADPRHAEEGPPRQTTVGDYWIDQTEVTNADFARFVAATGYVTLAERPLDPKKYPGLSAEQLAPSSIVFVGPADPRTSALDGWAVIPGANWRHPGGPGTSIEGRDRHPVVQVGWEDAKAYAQWRGRDLPTEAEWEFASRGGLQGAAYTWGDDPPGDKPLANIWQGLFPVNDAGSDGYKTETAPVGCFPSNAYGLYDMAGNVWEWTTDWYSPGLDPGETRSPQGPGQTSAFDPREPGAPKHVIKGGSFLCADNYCFRYRPAAREAGPSDTGSSHIGFRTVLRVVDTKPE